MFSFLWSNSPIRYTALLSRVNVWPKTEELMSSVQNLSTKLMRVDIFLILLWTIVMSMKGICMSAVMSLAVPVIKMMF